MSLLSNLLRTSLCDNISLIELVLLSRIVITSCINLNIRDDTIEIKLRYKRYIIMKRSGTPYYGERSFNPFSSDENSIITFSNTSYNCTIMVIEYNGSLLPSKLSLYCIYDGVDIDCHLEMIDNNQYRGISTNGKNNDIELYIFRFNNEYSNYQDEVINAYIEEGCRIRVYGEDEDTITHNMNVVEKTLHDKLEL